MAETQKIVCMSASLKLYRIFGIFPRKNKELNPGKLFYLRFILLAILSSLVPVGSLLHLIKSINDSVYDFLAEDITYIVSLGFAYFAISTFLFKVHVAAQLFIFLSDFEEFGKPMDFDEMNQFLDKLTIYHYFSIEFLILTILFLSGVSGRQKCERDNLQYSLQEVCGLVSNTWMPFDIDYFPVRQIFVFFQLWGAHYLYAVAGLLAWNTPETVQHIIVRLRYVKRLFIDSIREENVCKRREKFNLAVKCHTAVLSVERKLYDLFGGFMQCHMVSTAIILGTGTYSLIHGRNLSTFLVGLGWFWGLILNSVSGQRLQNESFSIGEALCNTNWYDCSEDIKKDIKLVLMRCRRPMHLRAAFYGVLGHEMFLGVVKASYSYIAVLSQTKY